MIPSKAIPSTHSRQQFLAALQSCHQVPKDDRLLIRRYFTTLSNFCQQPLVKLILSHPKGGIINNKLQIRLRKEAEQIRKKQQEKMMQKKSCQENTGKGFSKREQPYFERRTPLTRIQTVANSRNNSRASKNNSERSRKIETIAMSSRKNQQSTFSPKPYVGGRRIIKILPTVNRMLASNTSKKRQKNQSEKSSQGEREKSKREISHIKSPKNSLNHHYSRSKSWDQYLSSPIVTTAPGTQSFSTTPRSITMGKESYFSLVDSNPARNRSDNDLHSELKKLQIVSQDFFDFLIPEVLRIRSPQSLSMPYHQLMSKLTSFIITKLPYNSQSEKLTNRISSTAFSFFVFRPFISEYDVVTLPKLQIFLGEYMHPKLHDNPVRDTFMRMAIGVQAMEQFKFNEYNAITIQSFERAYQWKKKQVRDSYLNLVKNCSPCRNGLSYWQLYWIKDTQLFKQFCQLFHDC